MNPFLHILLSLIGEGILAVALVIGLIYLFQSIRLKRKKIFLRASHLPSLEWLDRIQTKLLVIGFISLTLGILMGIYWATHEMGWRWVWGPKQLWMFLGWFVYGLILKMRFSQGFRAKKAAWYSMIAFALVLFAGLHGWIFR